MTKDEHPLIRGLRWILANRKQPNGRRMSMRALSTAAGLSPSHVEQIINQRQSPDGVGLSTLQALAAAAQVRLEWLQTGEGIPDSSDATPHTPPAKSDVRAKTYAAHWFPDEVEHAFALALQHPDAPSMADPRASQWLIAGKVAFRDRMTKLAPDLVVDFCVQLLQAAKALDEAGQLGPPDDEETKGALMSEMFRSTRSPGKAQPARPGVSTSAAALTAKANETLVEHGVFPSRAVIERRRKADEEIAKKKGKG